MWLLRGILDRLILLAGVFAAGCVPGFIGQYRQRLGGRLEQVTLDLAPYQAIADRQQQGSLDALVQYHLHSADPIFHQEGQALQVMMQTADRLRAMAQSLDTDLAHQFAYLLTHADSGLLHATWADYHPGLALDPQGMIFALIVGVLLWAVFVLLWQGVGWMVRSIAGTPSVGGATPR